MFSALAKEGKNSGVLTLEPHLMEFVGLFDLEQEGEKSAVGGISYSNERAAFDHATQCLKRIIDGSL